MSMLAFAHLARPENFHEIARLRLIEVIEVLSKLQLVKKASRTGPICIPPAPDAFAVALISDYQPLQCGVIEVQLASRAQPLDRLMKTRYVAPEQKLGDAAEGKMK